MTTIRRLQQTWTKGNRHVIAWMGDSVVYNHTLRNDPAQMPAAICEYLLREENSCAVECQNFGVAGSNTTQMLASIGELLQWDGGLRRFRSIPDIVCIGTGGNDSGDGINQATSAANVVAMVRYLRNGCKDSVSGQASLPAAEWMPGDRMLVLSDTSTTGGVAPPTGAAHATVTGTVTGPTIWECRNGLAGESGWSRVADLDAADRVVNRFILFSPHFINTTSGADTYAAGSHSGQRAAYLQAHDAMESAQTTLGGTAEGVEYVDLYLRFQELLASPGWDTVASGGWHYLPTDVHLNPHGSYLFGDFIRDRIVSASSGAWLTALQAD